MQVACKCHESAMRVRFSHAWTEWNEYIVIYEYYWVYYILWYVLWRLIYSKGVLDLAMMIACMMVASIIIAIDLSSLHLQPIPLGVSFSKAQSSKLERLFCHVSMKRDIRALSFELWNSIRNCHPKWDWLYDCMYDGRMYCDEESMYFDDEGMYLMMNACIFGPYISVVYSDAPLAARARSQHS